MKIFQTTADGNLSAQNPEERLSFLANYCEGWSKGDSEMIHSAVVDDFVWDDPAEGRVSKDGLGSFLPKFKEAIDRARNRSISASYLTLFDWVVDRSQLTTTFWCSFAVPGTSVEGTCQIRVGDKGVISEHRVYRTRSHVRGAKKRSKN